MKTRFFRRVTAFAVSSLLACGIFMVFPEEYFSQIGIIAGAEETATSGQCGDNAFWELDGNGVLTISGTGSMYDYYGFATYTQIVSIIIDEGITSIGAKSFASLYNLKSVYLPTTLQTIGDSAFNSCTELSNIDLPSGLITIQSGVFNSCESLQHINIPSSVTSIGDSAFLACDNLESIEVDLDNDYFTSVDGVLFTKDMKTIINYPAKKTNTEYSIPNTVTFIKNAAFWDCQSLSLINIPTSVKSIDSYAFYGCSALNNILLPNSVSYVGMYAFSNCKSLSNIKLSASIKHLSTGLFEDCSSLENITIPYGVQSIDGYVFSKTAIKDIVIPNSVERIIERAFCSCDSLISITIPQSVTSINDVINYDHHWHDYTIYGYSGSYVEAYSKENNYNFVALDGNKEFTSATMTQFTNPVNVSDELLFNVVIRDSNGKPVNISDLPTELTYTVSVSDTKCIRIDDGSIDLTGAFIKATAIGEGTATVTVTFSNGVSATSTVKVGKSETGDDNTDTSSDSRYDYLYLDFTPKNLSYTYSADTESFNDSSTECEINLSCLNLLQNGLFMDVNKIVVTPPKGFSINGKGERVPHEYTYIVPEPINGGSNGDISEHFVLYMPTKEFLKGNPITESSTEELTITVYGDDNFVKTFKQSFYIKYVSSNGETDDPIPDNTIVIDEQFSGDIIVNEGEYVVIRSQYGENYKAEINCDNLYVRGGICKIVGTAALNVSGNVEVTGGKTNWLNPISSDIEGGVLEVDGKLNVNGNMLVGEDCGILNMTKSRSMVDVKGDFKITTNSTKYTCNLSDGILKIGGSFEASGKYSGNFQASENHLTLFYGNDFNLTIDKSKAFFNNLSFTESALNSVTYQNKLLNFKLYTSNVKDKFYLYKSNTDLSYLFEDYNPVKSTLNQTYKKYLEQSDFKNSMSGLKKYISNIDYFDKIVADTKLFCDIENMAIDTGTSSYGYDLSGLFGDIKAIAYFVNGETVLEFSENNQPTVYMYITWIGQSLGSNSSNSSAVLFNLHWILTSDNEHYIHSAPILLSCSDLTNLNSQLVQIYKDSTDTNGKPEDYLKWFSNYVLDGYTDIDSLFNGFFFWKDTENLDFSKAKSVTTLCSNVYKSVTNKNLKAFEIKDPYTAMSLYNKLKKILKSPNDSDFAKIISIYCPVDVEIKNSQNDIVASIVNNEIVTATDSISISIIDGDKKICHINNLDKYTIKLTGTASGTMDYIIQELNSAEVTRIVTFNNLPLTNGNVYTGSIDEFLMQSAETYALTDNNGQTFYPNSDTISSTPNITVPPSIIGSNENAIIPTNSSTSITLTVKVENKITEKTNKSKATRTGESVTVFVGKENNGYYANIYTTDGNLLDAALRKNFCKIKNCDKKRYDGAA